MLWVHARQGLHPVISEGGAAAARARGEHWLLESRPSPAVEAPLLSGVWSVLSFRPEKSAAGVSVVWHSCGGGQSAQGSKSFVWLENPTAWVTRSRTRGHRQNQHAQEITAYYTCWLCEPGGMFSSLGSPGDTLGKRLHSVVAVRVSMCINSGWHSPVAVQWRCWIQYLGGYYGAHWLHAHPFRQ